MYKKKNRYCSELCIRIYFLRLFLYSKGSVSDFYIELQMFNRKMDKKKIAKRQFSVKCAATPLWVWGRRGGRVIAIKINRTDSFIPLEIFGIRFPSENSFSYVIPGFFLFFFFIIIV